MCLIEKMVVNSLTFLELICLLIIILYWDNLFFCSCSLKALHKKLVMGVIRQREGKTEIICAENDWCCDNQSVQAVWRLVRMCGLGEGNSLLAWVSDLISKVLMFCTLLYPRCFDCPWF